MAYLDWSHSSARVAIDSTREEKISVRVQGLAAEEFSVLASAVQSVNRQEDPELRIDFPSRFTLFIKSRPDVSRCLVAHPEPEVWVGTLALSLAHGDALGDALLGRARNSGTDHEPAPAISVYRLARVDRTSNLELVLE